jgi:hypothetical protein
MIDLCISVEEEENALLLLGLYFKSLIKNNDLGGVSVHIVGHTNYEFPLPVKLWERPLFESGSRHSGHYTPVAYNTSQTMQFMMDNCGDEDWVIISHYDLMFKGDFIGFIKNNISENVGQIGEHQFGAVAYNRKAYCESGVKFCSFSGAVIGGGNKLSHLNDTRIKGKGMPEIWGWDVAELYTIEVQSRGWQLIAVPENNNYYEHQRSGSNYNKDSEVNRIIKRDTLQKLNKLGLGSKVI